MKNRKRKINILRLMSYGIITWFIVFPIFIFFLFPSCSILVKKTPEKFIETAKKYFKKEDYKKAYKNYTRAIELNPFYYPAYWDRSQVEIKTDSLERAIDDMNMFIGNTSDQKILQNAYYQRAIIMFKQGYQSDGCDDLKNSCDLNFNKGCDMYRLKCK